MIDIEGITTGVHSSADCNLWDFDDGIDLALEEHMATVPHKDGEPCADCDCWEAGTTLFGGWKKDPKDGKWDIDKSGEHEYAAIWNPDYFTVQVIWSRFAVRCRRCSPCYPNQGDVDSPGDDWVAYIIPPDIMSEHWLEKNGARIIWLEGIRA